MLYRLNLKWVTTLLGQAPPSLVINQKAFNVLKKKSKDYYSLLLSKKAQFPNRGLTLKREFDLTGDELQKV